VDEDGAVGLEDEQPDRLRQHGRQAAGVGDFAAGYDETHRRGTVLSVSDMTASSAQEVALIVQPCGLLRQRIEVGQFEGDAATGSLRTRTAGLAHVGVRRRIFEEEIATAP
jgi:hypothetical protein